MAAGRRDAGTMDPGFDNLESSLSLDDSLMGQTDSIDSMYHTYLGSMDTFPSASAAPGSYEGQESRSFQTVNIVDWGGEECLEWAESVCRRCGIERSTVDLWHLSSTTGSSLLQYTEQYFCHTLGPQHGRLFHRELQALIKRSARGKKKVGGRLRGEASGVSYPTSSPASSCDPDSWDFTSDDFKDLDRYISDETWDPLVGNLQGLDLQEDFMPIKYEPEDQQCQYPAAAAAAAFPAEEPVSPSEAAASSTDVFKKIPTNTRRRERGPKSWEFLIRLLADKRTNPTLIRWEDEASATFRLTQPSIIAKMWGARADKSNLSYVNFARGLRYHYNTGALMAVSERQLVYRCGPKALKYLKELQEQGLR